MGFDAINAWLSGHGLTESRVERKMLDFDAVSAGKNNYISAGDLYRMFCMALRMEQDGDGLPLDLLKENRDDTLLRRYLYEGYPAAHKSGQLDDVLHDAGVIFDRRGRIFIAVMLTGFPPEKMHEAEKLIGRIARMTEDSRIR
jgi:beta-lactamase class A